jgi:hypothetical protein
MSATAPKNWKQDFGIDGRTAPAFFASKQDVDAAVPPPPQSQVLRRAFDDLKLSGVLLQDNSPIIYFREIARIEPSGVAALHRTFWNQGVAPILVLVSPEEVHVYSGLYQPDMTRESNSTPGGFVEKLNRVAVELQAFILAVESGEYFHRHRKAFDPRQRVDRNLLRHLEAAREMLDKVPAARLDPLTLDALLCRVVFTCYLFDRKIIDDKYLEEAGIKGAEHLRDILGRKPRSEA